MWICPMHLTFLKVSVNSFSEWFGAPINNFHRKRLCGKTNIFCFRLKKQVAGRNVAQSRYFFIIWLFCAVKNAKITFLPFFGRRLRLLCLFCIENGRADAVVDVELESTTGNGHFVQNWYFLGFWFVFCHFNIIFIFLKNEIRFLNLILSQGRIRWIYEILVFYLILQIFDCWYIWNSDETIESWIWAERLNFVVLCYFAWG